MLFSLSMLVKGNFTVADVTGKGQLWAGVSGHRSVPGTMPALARPASIWATSMPGAAHRMAVAVTVLLPPGFCGAEDWVWCGAGQQKKQGRRVRKRLQGCVKELVRYSQNHRKAAAT